MVCEKMYQEAESNRTAYYQEMERQLRESREKIWELMNKPHAPTIKAIVEAFESVIRETALEKVDAGDIKLVLHRLRSILKEL